MTILGAAMKLVGFWNRADAVTLFGVAFLTVALPLLLLCILDVGVRGRLHRF